MASVAARATKPTTARRARARAIEEDLLLTAVCA